MTMKSLMELSIISVCENVTSVAEFLVESPLPWTLTQCILKKYSKYKWKHINWLALNDNSRFLKCMEFIPLDNTFSLSQRNAVLATNWGDIFENYKYCLWVNRYVIKRYNLLVCKTCYDSFKIAFKYLKKNLNIFNDHYHCTRDAQDLVSEVYQNKKFWCQSCYWQVLFNLEDDESCTLKLHSTPSKKIRFRGRYDSDSDIDIDSSEFDSDSST